MKKMTILLLLLVAAVSAGAQKRKPFDIQLWEKGYTVTNGDEDKTFKSSGEVSRPDMRVFLPEKSNGRAVVILPGGGYVYVAVNHEGYDFAPFFNNEGIAVIVLRYRMPKGNPAVPFADVEEAFRIVRDSASSWNIDPSKIGIMGSSAGGHLASTYATKCKSEKAPAFQVLLYPVISMQPGVTHQGSHDNLLGKDASQQLVDLYCNEKQVTEKTAPAFLALSDDDGAVPPVNGVNYYLALNRAGVSSSMHVYPVGGHGWGSRDAFRFNLEFMSELRAWLRNLD